MIEIKTTTTYRVVCDECGATAGQAQIRLEAVEIARNSGFQFHTTWNGLEHVTRHLCPRCHAAGRQGGRT